MADGMAQLWCKICQRDQDKCPFSQTWMWYLQLPPLHDFIIIEQDVDVDQARSVPLGWDTT